MRKQSLKKVIIVGVLTASMFAVLPAGASAAWRQNGTGWWYTEGNSYSRGWRNIEGTWYYFDNNGYMKTGWLNNGGWYYFSSSGVMQTGWIQDGGGTWYYLKPNGVMATGNMAINGEVSRFDVSGKWLGYVNSNQNINNGQQSGTTANNNQQQAGGIVNNSSTVSQSTQTNASSAQQNNTSNTSTNNINLNSNNNSQGSSNTNGTQGSSNSNSNQGNSNINNSQGNINLNSSTNTVISQNINNGSINSASGTNSNNQAVTSNQANGEFSINDALRMISNYKGVAVTLTPPGPTSGIDAAYEKIHKDGKVGYYIFSYLFNGRRVDNSSGILIFEDGIYKQYKQGHHPSELYADEWVEEKKQHDEALKDFLSHVQPTHDGNYDYNYHGKTYGFTILEGMEQWSLYRIFHAEEFDRDGYHIDLANNYLETANIRIN